MATKTQSIEALTADLAKKREELRVVRFAAAGSRSRNVRESRTLRRDIARVLTMINAQKVAETAKTK